MAKRRTHKSRKSYKPKGGKTTYGQCLSRHMKGKRPKGKAAKAKMMRSANKACRPILCRKR
jgi:hypothetical protein